MSEILEKNKIIIVMFLALVAIIMGITILLRINSIGDEEIVIEKRTEDENNTEEEKFVRVDIQGEVEKPGVYKLSEGAIFEEILEKAGGLTEKADEDFIEKNLNRAQLLTDQQKIYIPAIGESSGQTLGGETSQTLNGKISINNASLSELDSLPGIGPAYAQKIIDGRPYKSIEEVKSVKGIGESTFEKIKDRIVL
ncbi:MAG: helix-hairpin-helix domain-containing protein [Patescibacteria group bacterium]|nr:helix-hairpin-helix domain-containing protein [Patescibacteria group bacterium]